MQHLNPLTYPLFIADQVQVPTKLLVVIALCLAWSPWGAAAQEGSILGSGVYYASSINIGSAYTTDPRIRKELDYNDPTMFFQENSIEKNFNGLYSFDDYLVYAMRSVSLVAGVDSDVHRYSAQHDLVNSFARTSGGNSDARGELLGSNETLITGLVGSIEDEDELQQTKCGQHLDVVLREARLLFESQENYSKSRQLSFIDYLDSFGSPMSLLMYGNTAWFGSHDQCSRAKLSVTLNEIQLKEEVRTRYCVANYRSPNWPVVGPNEYIEQMGAQSSIKLGICLPDSCNSVSVLGYFERIDSLIKLTRLNRVPYSGYKLTNLFCLPDESSPLRQFSLSARIFILLLSSWLTMVAYFSLKYEYQRMKWIQSNGNSDDFSNLETSNSMKIFAFRLSWSKLFEGRAQRALQTAAEAATAAENCCQSNRRANLIEALRHQTTDFDVIGEDKLRHRVVSDLVNGSNQSFDFSNQQTDSSSVPADARAQHQNRNHNQTKEATAAERNSSYKPITARDVDLSIIDGLKVTSMIWLVCAHTLLIFIRTIANGRDFWSILKDARFMTALAGIFTVDTFFTATGVLTAFLKFSKNDGVPMGRVKYWLEAFVHRYLRFMPMYLLVFWYSRDVSEYTGSGPMWDYGTADTSLRWICKQESVTVPLLFKANFRSIDETCIKPAWYLASDYQYLLMTPIFMALILKSKALGYSVLIGSTILSVILQFLTVFYSSEYSDFEVLINFKPMFGAYVLKNFWKLYVLPYNRIPPYLIGLLTGHLIYSLSKSYAAQRQQQHDRDRERSRNSEIEFNDANQQHSSQHHHHHLSSSRIGIINSQDSLSSLPTMSTHSENTSDIVKRHSAKSYSVISSSSSSTFFGALKGYLCIRVWTPLLLLISIIYLPMLTKILTQKGWLAKIGTSALMTLMRLVWSLAIARLIYISSTRFLDINYHNKPSKGDSFVIRFLSSSKWKPWSEMGLTALLIQWEIIGYLAQIQTGLPTMTLTFLLSTALVSIVATYSLSLVIYLTIEYPLSQVEQLYIHPVLFQKS